MKAAVGSKWSPTDKLVAPYKNSAYTVDVVIALVELPLTEPPEGPLSFAPAELLPPSPVFQTLTV